MATHQDEDLKMALRLSMQQEESPEPKENSSDQPPPPEESSEESPEVKNRRIQRDLMAAAAEKRMKSVESVKDVQIRASDDESKGKGVGSEEVEAKSGISGMELSVVEANKLFLMIFGEGVSKNVLAQWCNQGIRFSVDHETSIGLVQHEGGPCGVLSAIQGFILKYLLFSPEESCSVVQKKLPCLAMRRVFNDVPVASDNFSSLSEDTKLRALVRSMSEILFQCGSNKAAVIVSLNILDLVDSTKGTEDEAIAKALGCLSVESGSDFQKVLRVNTFTSQSGAIQKLEALLPIFRSRLGALLFLISALLSRGLDAVQEDRDDPTQPLVTAPFGHASQEIVNLLLSGSAVSNVFDENIDLGGGMFVKGISTTVEVGFLTLLESLNYCKVGQYLKCPHWPIWVVGSESHYTVLFALDTKVQEENELENRETEIRRAFDGQDQSGGGGFISVEGFHQVLKETSINLPQEKVQHLCSTEFIVWSEFWQVIMDLDKSLGGLKDISGAVGSMVFDLYHYNGIAKSFTTSNQESFGQRPRLTKLRVTVPPAVEYLPAGPVPKEVGSSSEGGFKAAQHAPLVDCIRTRWARSMCNWEGDSPSIV